MRTRRAAAAIACSLLAAALAVGAAGAGDFTAKGAVSRVVDGDTLDVVLASGKRERVRLIGIDAPERGACGATGATSAARRLAQGKAVVLRGDATQATRDRYGRLLAYIWLPGGKDLGFQLLAGGHARVYVYDRPFRRLRAYWSVEAGARGTGVRACAAARAAPPRPRTAVARAGGGRCRTGYSPCLPVVGDLDCADIGFTVRVTGSDPYRLDGDGDGLGCE
jgi:micrococcal nuclease